MPLAAPAAAHHAYLWRRSDVEPTIRRKRQGKKSARRRRVSSSSYTGKPSFELLEQRLLLSADTLGMQLAGLAGVLEPDDGSTESVAFDHVAAGAAAVAGEVQYASDPAASSVR